MQLTFFFFFSSGLHASHSLFKGIPLHFLFSPSFLFPWIHLQFRVFTAPFHRVEFADFWLADQLNSLVFVLMDLEYLICFYIFELQWSNRDGLLPNLNGELLICGHGVFTSLLVHVQKKINK